MKKFRCLLLDTGPIIELHRLKLWGRFLECCEVTVARTVAEEETQFSGEGLDKEYFDLADDIAQSRVSIVELGTSAVVEFRKAIPLTLAQVDPGELETLAFLFSQDGSWKVCAADNAVYRVLGYLGRGEQGISLEEILKEIGLEQNLKKQFTKNFRKNCTKQGEVEGIHRGKIH